MTDERFAEIEEELKAFEEARPNSPIVNSFYFNAPGYIAELIAEVRRLNSLLEDLDYRPDC